MGKLVQEFLKNKRRVVHTQSRAIDEAFCLSEQEYTSAKIALPDRSKYSVPGHTVQRATTLLNRTLKRIDKDSLLNRIDHSIKKKKAVFA